MTTNPLPGGYRIQLARRVAETPPEIDGEWAVHCTLCKHVQWVDTHEGALRVAHEAHPATDIHQKWIGRVLTGGVLPERRGYHLIRSDSGRRITFGGDWHPGVTPHWVMRLRDRGIRDEMSIRRDDRELRQARAAATRIEPEFIQVGDTRVTVRDSRGGRREFPAAEVEVRIVGRQIASVYVLGDGSCFNAATGKLLGSIDETNDHFTRMATMAVRGGLA